VNSDALVLDRGKSIDVFGTVSHDFVGGEADHVAGGRAAKRDIDDVETFEELALDLRATTNQSSRTDNAHDATEVEVSLGDGHNANFVGHVA